MSTLHIEYRRDSDSGDPEEVKDIKAYIEQTPDRDFSHILKYDGRWPVFYHLSEMRESLLNWYEFKKGAELLEIGGGMGALTGLFCKRCSHVTTVESSELKAKAIHERYRDIENLDIYIGNIGDMDLGKKFDYITVIGELEYQGDYSDSENPYVDFLKKLAGLLKPDGKLLLAIENRYGIKYWCGSVEDHSGIPYDGIDGYKSGEKARTFGKKELERIILSSGLNKYKFYYPMPDYKLPQVIYSEKYLPQNNLQARVIPYYLNHAALLASEMDLYDDLIENDVFEFFSNSFLVECGFDDKFCSVIYAASTADRSPGSRFCTTIHENNTVQKKPLDEKGFTTIQKIFENISELKARGIRTVPHKIEQNALIMPRFDCESLESHLKRIIKQDKDSFVLLFDKLYQCILNSSDQSDPELNYFLKIYPNLDFGPILKKAYIDLIPNNCFYFNNELVFFDQEFVRENFPANFVMFRALKYIYWFVPSANDSVPLEEMKRRYKLSEIWDIYEKEEAEFVKENRNYSLYKHFLQWAYIDKKVFSQNAKKLMRSAAAQYLIQKGYHKIAIYGFGNLGNKLYRELKGSGVEVLYAIDQNAQDIKKTEYTQIPVIRPDDEYKPADAIIVSVASEFDFISSTLRGKINCPVISYSDIMQAGL